MAEGAEQISIEIAYAEPQRALIKTFLLPQGARVSDALALAVRDDQLRHLDLRGAMLGIYGQLVQHEQVLSDGDRIEIYRPLAEDPKAARRKRASRHGRS